MNIPEEAVNAALAVGNFQHGDVLEGTITRDDREWCGYVGNMGTILEDFIKAAAPFIAAQAWDEGYKWGRSDESLGAHRPRRTPNPHRSTQ